MAGSSKKLNNTIRAFIERQNLFFVATAARDGRVNVSPKGVDTLRILNDNRIIWLSLTGSGNETATHLLDTPRMTLMFCAFESDPLIVRVYGSATVTHPRHENWGELISYFPTLAGSRQIFDLDIDLVTTSCGTSVPEMSLVRTRGETDLVPWYADMGPDGVNEFWRKKNLISIDGKPTGIFTDDV